LKYLVYFQTAWVLQEDYLYICRIFWYAIFNLIKNYLALFSGAGEKAFSSLPVEMRESLTIREKEVFLSLASRLTDKEIAKEIDISVETVRTHRRNIYRKPGKEVVSDLNLIPQKKYQRSWLVL